VIAKCGLARGLVASSIVSVTPYGADEHLRLADGAVVIVAVVAATAPAAVFCKVREQAVTALFQKLTRRVGELVSRTFGT